MEKKITKDQIINIDTCFKIQEKYFFKVIQKNNSIYPEHQDLLTLKDVDDDIKDMVKKFHKIHGDKYSSDLSKSVVRRFKIQKRGVNDNT